MNDPKYDMVRDYLMHEKTELLSEAYKEIAKLRAGLTEPFSQFMADGWLEYFEELVAQTDSMLTLEHPALKQCLEDEKYALDKVVLALDQAIRTGSYTMEGEFLLEKMKKLLEIETDSTKDMADAL